MNTRVRTRALKHTHISANLIYLFCNRCYREHENIGTVLFIELTTSRVGTFYSSLLCMLNNLFNKTSDSNMLHKIFHVWNSVFDKRSLIQSTYGIHKLNGEKKKRESRRSSVNPPVPRVFPFRSLCKRKTDTRQLYWYIIWKDVDKLLILQTFQFRCHNGVGFYMNGAVFKSCIC